MEMFCLGNVMRVGTEEHTGIEHVHKGYTQTLRRQEPLNHGKCEALKPFSVLIFKTDKEQVR